MPWTTPHPPVDTELDACVTCGLCLPVCPTFRLTGDEAASPRGRLTAIAAVASGDAVVDERFADVTGFCLQCRACETACPSLVPYGGIIESARAEVVDQLGGVPWWERFAVTRVLATPWLLRVVTVLMGLLQRVGLLRFAPAMGTQTRGLRRIPIPVRTARGGDWGDPAGPTVVLFTGCVADAWFPDIHAATVFVLRRAGYHVVAPPSQTCCGALAAHAGLAEDAERLAGVNIATLVDADRIVADVAGCGAHLRSYGRHGATGQAVASAVSDVTELVAEAIAEGRLPEFPSVGRTVGVQDPCHLEHGQRVTSAPRLVVAAAGYDVVDVDPSGPCCGAAGLYQVSHPETGEALGRAKAAAVAAADVGIVASANVGCEMQLRRFVGRDVAVRHPVEIYADALRAGADADRAS